VKYNSPKIRDISCSSLARGIPSIKAWINNPTIKAAGGCYFHYDGESVRVQTFGKASRIICRRTPPITNIPRLLLPAEV